ncbi:MAG TPA: aldo/keto reductase [Casimicrobiaceae bacterium]
MPLDPALRDRLAEPPLALGGAPLGNLFRALSEVDAHAVVQRAWDLGVRCFDTAPHYGQGLSERRMGTVLRTLPREAFLLSTKVGRILTPDAAAPRDRHGYVDTLPYVQRYDYTADGVRRSLDDSLERLGLARVDLVYVHDIDPTTHGVGHAARFRDMLDGALPALASLEREGAIGGYGLGVNEVGICLDTLARADLGVILLAGRYTLADQEALAALLPECERRGVAVVLGGPFNSGILASGAHPADGSTPYFNYAPAAPAIIDRVAAIERVCDAFGVPLKAAALQFPRAHPAITCVLAGARSTSEIEENVRLARHPIPAAFWRALRDERLIDAASPLPAS